MSVPRRMSAIRRLFLAKLEDISSDMPEEARAEAARAELDKILGHEWRKEVHDAGFGMDPTGEDTIENRLQKATVNEGFDGGNVPEPTKPKIERLDKLSLLERLKSFFG